MNQENGRLLAVDAILERFSRVSVPPDVELRLQTRMHEFCRQPETVPAQTASSSRFRRFLPTCVAALAAAVVLVATVVLIGNRDAWAQVAKSLQLKPWVRWTLQGPDGAPLHEGLRPPETWFSARHRVVARRFMNAVQYVDIVHQETYDYDPIKNTVIHSLTGDDDNVDFGHLEVLLRLVAEGDQKLKLPESPIQIVERTWREVLDRNRPWIEFTFQCRDPRRTFPEYSMTFRVDPQSRLVVEMRSTERLLSNDTAEVRTYAVDYPESGPDDIHALGVPRNAVIVDRRRARSRDAKEIREFLAAYVEARLKPIEPYSTMALVTPPGQSVSDVLRAFQGWHDGKTLRVEESDRDELLELRKKVWSQRIALPNDVDRAQWWRQEIAQLPFAPMSHGEERLPHTIGYPLLAGAASPSNPVPNLDNPDCRVSLDRHPLVGPAGSIRLKIVVDTPAGFNEGNYWIDPERDYLVLRSEFFHSRNHAAWDNVTQIIDRVEKSPGGRWYATEVRMGRIEKSGDDLSGEVVNRTELKTGMENGPVSTSVFRYFVEFK